ncbi:MAG: hypothetical protein AMXMBFR33_35150 [Candidatus Xenobia bacterium]
MKLLLDTQVYLWYLEDSPRLTPLARGHILNAQAVVISAASIWEAAIKVGTGKLEVDPLDLIAGVEGSGFTHLPVTAHHGAAVAALPPIHRDPFDRLLVAQSVCESAWLLTADTQLARYPADILMA